MKMRIMVLHECIVCIHFHLSLFCLCYRQCKMTLKSYFLLAFIVFLLSAQTTVTDRSTSNSVVRVGHPHGPSTQSLWTLLLIFQNLYRSRHSEHTTFGSIVSCVHSYSSVSISTRNLKCLASQIIKI